MQDVLLTMLDSYNSRSILPLRTFVSSSRGHIGKELDKVRQVVSKEFGADDYIFAGCVRGDCRAKELRLALYAKGGASLGILLRYVISRARSLHSLPSYLEGIQLQRLRETWQRLESSPCSRHNGHARHWTLEVSRSDLDSLRFSCLVLERA